MNVERTWLYTFARKLAAFIYPVFFRAKAEGVENFPEAQNCILLGNHISAWDPITIAYFYKHNEIHFMAKESLYKIPILRTLLNWLHAFPVHRGESDMNAMRTAMQVLRDGHVLGIFPEGHRHRTGEIQTLETGIAVLALKSSVPVIPVFIYGSYRLFGKVRAVVGPAIELADLREMRPTKETLETVKARVLYSLESLQQRADQ